MTFDTSLVDLNSSFSTTESDPSDSNARATTKVRATPQSTLQTGDSLKQSRQALDKASTATSLPDKTSTQIQTLPTLDAYDQWASTYDTDGNMLQAIDDLALVELLPTVLRRFESSTASNDLNLIDLGCGTGRNTAKLIKHPFPLRRQVHITALDFSAGMLDVAAKKMTPLLSAHPNVVLHLQQTNCFPTVDDPTASARPVFAARPVRTASTSDQSSTITDPTKATDTPYHFLLSTLVLEHVPLTPFFHTLSALLTTPDSLALITNMHSDMAAANSQASFVVPSPLPLSSPSAPLATSDSVSCNKDSKTPQPSTAATQVKVRAGESYAHSVADVVAEAERDALWEVLDVRERAVEEQDLVSGRVGARGRKWLGKKVWFGVLLRRRGVEKGRTAGEKRGRVGQ